MPHGHLCYEDGTLAIHGIPDVEFHHQKRSFLIKNFGGPSDWVCMMGGWDFVNKFWDCEVLAISGKKSKCETPISKRPFLIRNFGGPSDWDRMMGE